MACAWLMAVCLSWPTASEPNWATVAALEKDPHRLVKRTMDAVLSTLQSNQLDLEAKKSSVVKIVTTVLDLDVMARLTIGRHWPSLSDQQKQRFRGLFLELLKQAYLDKLADYNDHKVVMRPGKSSDNRAQIPTELVSKDKTIPILYKLHVSGDRWLVYDVEIDGVSLVMTYRAQFQDVLQKASITELMDQIQQRLQDSNRPDKG